MPGRESGRPERESGACRAAVPLVVVMTEAATVVVPLVVAMPAETMSVETVTLMVAPVRAMRSLLRTH